MDKSIFDIVKLLPEKVPQTNRKIKIYNRRNKLVIKCINYRKDGKLVPISPKPIKIPRYVKIDTDLGIFVGLILTEGLRSQEKKSRNMFILMNTDPDVIAICLFLLKRKFELPLRIYKFHLHIPPFLMKSSKKIEKIWREKLNLPGNTKIFRYAQTDLKRPKFAIFIYRSTFRFIIDCIIEESLKYIKRNKEFRIGFLKGVFAAEGSIELRKNNSLHFAYFSQCNDKNREIIKQALTLCKIKFKERLNPHSKDLRISHLHNFEIINKLNICSICKIKGKKFKSGLFKLRKDSHAGRTVGQTKQEIIQLLGKEGPLTVSQIALKLNVSCYTISDHILRKNRANIFENIKPVGKKRNIVGRSATLWALK